MSPTSIVAYLTLFAGGAFAFLLVALGIGWFLRPRNVTAVKLSTYECGEPAVGSSYAQFDLRFYVIALVFLIFDVEVAFLFPWAVVYGKSNQIAALATASQSGSTEAAKALGDKYRELGATMTPLAADEASRGRQLADVRSDARDLAWFAMLDMAVFFLVLLVGFAYVWYRGDLDWVRAAAQRAGVQTPGRVAAAPDATVR